MTSSGLSQIGQGEWHLKDRGVYKGYVVSHVILELILLEECSIVKSFRLVKSPI